MSVCILGTILDWGTETAVAARATGSITRVVGVATIEAMAADTRVMLASSAAPASAIMAFFAASPALGGRKIVAVMEDGPSALPLFDVADMLIFSPAALARTLGSRDVPDDVTALLPVQALLTRDNQAAVVRLAGKGAAAVWADRTLFVAKPAPGDAARTMGHFAGVIAAAVDRGIGPEEALAMALATNTAPVAT